MISDASGTGNTGWPLGKKKRGAGVYELDGHFISFKLSIVNLLLIK